MPAAMPYAATSRTQARDAIRPSPITRDPEGMRRARRAAQAFGEPIMLMLSAPPNR